MFLYSFFMFGFDHVFSFRVYSLSLLTLLDPGRIKLWRGNLKWPPFWSDSTVWPQLLLFSGIKYNLFLKKLSRSVPRVCHYNHVVPRPYPQLKIQDVCFTAHCVKSVQIRSFYSVNLRIQSEYRKIRTRKNSVFGHFSRSGYNRKKLNRGANSEVGENPHLCRVM